jgi:ABC-type transporter Mla subunit MlaD
MAEGNSGGTGVLGVLVGALIVILVGGGILFAAGMIGGGGGDTTTLKVEAPNVGVPKPDAPKSTTGSSN